MSIRVHVFDDFHVHGASAPEWNQRYAQLSPGVMHSTLTEATVGSVHLFRKWMSERVVQQGCLPSGQICFALLSGSGNGLPRLQGHELKEDSIVVLRGGEEFTIQRPHGMELLAITFPNEIFESLIDEQSWSQQVRRRLASQTVRAPAEALRLFRTHLLAVLERPPIRHPTSSAIASEPSITRVFVASLRGLFEAACGAQRSVASASAAYVVAECHRIVSESAEAPPDIEALCQRLRVSRRMLQNSFRQVTDSTAVHYLRSLRLNLVRTRLMSTSTVHLSVSQAATERGFDHLSHFAERYKGLFAELPSQTPRARDTSAA